jgi:hypothetical protein
MQVPVLDEQTHQRLQPWKLRRLAVAGRLCGRRTIYRQFSDITNNWSAQTGRCAVLDEEGSQEAVQLKELVEPVTRGDPTRPRLSCPIHQHADQDHGGCWSTGNSVDTKQTAVVSNFSRAILQDWPTGHAKSCPEDPKDTSSYDDCDRPVAATRRAASDHCVIHHGDNDRCQFDCIKRQQKVNDD